MNIDNIEKRMERVYLSIGQRFDKNIEKHISIEHKDNGNNWQISISFDKEGEAAICNQIFGVISNIAKLKDHLKNLYKSKGGDIQNIENEIELSDHLKLIIDLDNKEKHCKLNNSRSGKYPYLDEVDRALSVMTNQDIQSSSFSVNPFTGQFEANGGVGVTLSAEIKDNNGIIICSLDELIDKSIKDWEKIIKKFNLISK